MENMDLQGELRKLFRLAADELVKSEKSAGNWISLTDSQIGVLEDNGNSSEDWSGVKISKGAMLNNVRNCRFSGEVRIALTPAEIDGSMVYPSFQESCFENVEILPGCRIENSKYLENLHIEEGTLIENCGRITYEQGSLCGCGEELELGVETGERNVPSFPYLDVFLAEALSGGANRADNLAMYSSFLDEFLLKLRSVKTGIIGRACILRDTAVVENCFIGSRVSIRNACAVRNSTLLGEEPGSTEVLDGALVRDSILKWGSRVDSMAIVEKSILGEASVVEKQGKLSSSFLGPNSVLAEGEITASLAGPFTVSHHQSLLIAARWPGGRGNIGYGANVGSNHTSRLPDQEIRPGEGMFFGLACSVKFPADFSEAPYSIIATGVTLLPQRVEFPFSLICEPFASVECVPPSFNQIIPAWVLSDNLFSIDRNESKYKSRNRARHFESGGSILREATVAMMISALAKLEVQSVKDVYTEKEISGLGKNYLTETHRKKAIDTYRFHVRYFALEGLTENEDSEDLSVFRRDILKREFPHASREELRGIHSEMRKKVAESIRMNTEKDYSRGCRIITDYADVR